MSPMLTTQHLLDVALKEVKRLREKLQEERKEFLADLDKIRIHCDEYDYNICTPFWDTIQKYQKKLTECGSGVNFRC